MKFKLNVESYFQGVIGADSIRYGQVVGLLMPSVLSHMFPNLVRYTSNNIEGVQDIDTSTTYKIFTSATGKFDVSASVTKGAGRGGIVVDNTTHFADFDSYILVNTADLPTVEIQIVGKE